MAIVIDFITSASIIWNWHRQFNIMIWSSERAMSMMIFEENGERWCSPLLKPIPNSNLRQKNQLIWFLSLFYSIKYSVVLSPLVPVISLGSIPLMYFHLNLTSQSDLNVFFFWNASPWEKKSGLFYGLRSFDLLEGFKRRLIRIHK